MSALGCELSVIDSMKKAQSYHTALLHLLHFKYFSPHIRHKSKKVSPDNGGFMRATEDRKLWKKSKNERVQALKPILGNGAPEGIRPSISKGSSNLIF